MKGYFDKPRMSQARHQDVFSRGGRHKMRPVTLAAPNLPPHVEDEYWTCARCHITYDPEAESAVPGVCPRCGHPSKPAEQESVRCEPQRR